MVDVMDVEVTVTDDEVIVNVVVAVVNADIRIAQRSLVFPQARLNGRGLAPVLLSLLPPKRKKPRKSSDQTAEAPVRGSGSVPLGNSSYQALAYRDTASPASWATSSSPNSMTPALLTSNPAETREQHFLFKTLLGFRSQVGIRPTEHLMTAAALHRLAPVEPDVVEAISGMQCSI